MTINGVDYTLPVFVIGSMLILFVLQILLYKLKRWKWLRYLPSGYVGFLLLLAALVFFFFHRKEIFRFECRDSVTFVLLCGFLRAGGFSGLDIQ